jgi:hypothetical protein
VAQKWLKKGGKKTFLICMFLVAKMVRSSIKTIDFSCSLFVSGCSRNLTQEKKKEKEKRKRKIDKGF